ncbi:MAG: mycothiol synthase [Actinomycetota bacterium]|nr:mycothiol synthase [Actinomycetota bacterium]
MTAFTVRQRIGEQDIASIASLANEISQFDHHQALDDHTWLDLVHGGRKGILGFTAHSSRDNQLIGYAQVSEGNETWALEVIVHPFFRRNEDGVTKGLIDKAIGAIASKGGGHVHAWLARGGDEIADAFKSAGFKKGRSIVQMRRKLPLDPWLRGTQLSVRNFEVDTDIEPWLEVNNLAFARHPEQGGWTRNTLEARMKEAWFDPNGFLLHFEGDQLAAFCWTKIHESNPKLGEIYVIGVHPDFGSKGLGKAIAIEALEYLNQKHIPVAMLYVDLENERALSLYRSLGFSPDHIDVAYTCDIKATDTSVII